MEYKTVDTKVVGIDDRTVIGISSVLGVIDAGNDLLFKGAFVKTINDRGDRVKHLWQHDFSMPPVAAIQELKEVGRMELPEDMKKKYPQAKGGLLVKRTYLDTERGNEILAGLKSSPAAITEMSFGYDAVKYDYETLKTEDDGEILVRNLREVRLWDTSDVNWGMNEATVANFVKSALPFMDTGKADEAKEWDPTQAKNIFEAHWDEMDEQERKRAASHFAWSKQNPADVFGDMKFLHHDPVESTAVGPANLAGVIAAMKALSEPDPGIPVQDRKAVYAHLAKHLEQFGKEPPDYKVLELYWSVGDAIKSVSPGIVLKGVSFDPSVVLNQLTQLDQLLRAEPEHINSASLTQQDITRELEIRKRQMALSLS